MKIKFYDSEALFADLAGEWDDLLANSAADQIFLTRDWLLTWWAAYQPGEIWSIVLRDDSGRLQGIAPWFCATDEAARRTIHPIGCVDVTDYLDVIARRGSEHETLQALTVWLADHRNEFDVIELCNFPEDTPTLDLWPEMLARAEFEVSVRVEDVCPIIQLPNDFKTYAQGLDKKNRHELRRKLRKAAGLTDWYIVNRHHDLKAEVDKFLHLMAASSAEKAAFLANDQNRRFMQTIAPKMFARGWLQLAFLTVNGEAAATYMNFDYDNRIMVYNSGHDPEAHGQLSPGIVLMARLIEYAILCRRDLFDFLRGGEPYKYDLGGQDTKVYRLEIAGGAQP